MVLFSGKTGEAIRKLTDPAGAAGDRLGTSVGALPDVDGDGVPDVIAGAAYNDAQATDAGRVVVFSGADGSVLARYAPGVTPEEIGESLAQHL